MKTALLTIAMAGIGLLAEPALAQTSTGAQASPGRSVEEQRNLERALDFWYNIFSPLKLEQWKDYVAVDYKEHYPGLKDGLAELLGFFRPIKEKAPNGNPPADPLLTMVDGDITFFLVPRQIADGKQKLSRELQRWKDGKQVEHWDSDSFNSTPATPSISGRTAQEQRNLQLVMDFWDNVATPIKPERYKEFVAEDYVEHDANLSPGGLKALVERGNSMKEKYPNGFPKAKLVHTLVDGDLVVLTRIADDGPELGGSFDPKRYLTAHVMRVKNGKIVERWSHVRRAPAASGS